MFGIFYAVFIVLFLIMLIIFDYTHNCLFSNAAGVEDVASAEEHISDDRSRRVASDLHISDTHKNYMFALAGCNLAPIVRLEHLLAKPPAKPVALQSSAEILPNVTALRFTNPEGQTFDGVLAMADHVIANNVLFYTGSATGAISDSSWFEGYSWKIILVKQCIEGNPHIGWAFFKSGIFFTDNAPSFVFLVLDNSLDEYSKELFRSTCSKAALSSSSSPLPYACNAALEEGDSGSGNGYVYDNRRDKSLFPMLLGQQAPRVAKKANKTNTMYRDM